jgi:hypothetical protein
MADFALSAALQNVRGPDQIALNKFFRMTQGVTNASLCGKVNDSLRAKLVERGAKRSLIRHVNALEDETTTIAQSLEPRLFQPGVVVRVQIVEPKNFIASLEQSG